MTTPTSRISNMTINRVSDAGADVTEGLGDNVYGKINNIAGGEVVDINGESWGPAGPDNWPTETFSLTDFTFDLLEASEQPEKFSPLDDLYLNVYRSWRDKDNNLVTAKRQYVGRFETKGTGTWNREPDMPRSLVFKPFRRIEGGGTNYQDLSKTGAANYVDTHTGEYFVGGTDIFAAMRTAHGL